MKRLEKELQIEFDAYLHKVERLAQVEFEAHVKPYCLKNGLDFLAGNGEYFFKWDNPQWPQPREPLFHYVNDSIPARLRAILDQPLPGLPQNSLGTLMPGFVHPKTYHHIKQGKLP